MGTLKQARPKWVDEARNLNINTQRIRTVESNRAVPQGKLPKDVFSKTLRKMVTQFEDRKREAESQAETCSTCDDPIDEVRCHLPGVEIAKLDFRETRASSDISTIVAGSDGA